MSTDYDVLHETPLLQKDGTYGKQYWQGRVIDVDGRPAYQTESWRILKDGSDSKHRVSDPTFTESKNVGKANETTPLEQAISEIDAKAEKKRDKRYWPDGQPKPDFLAMPMKGKKYGVIQGGEFVSKRGPDKVDFPAAVQPKLDGVRMIFDGEKGWSRKLKIFEEHCWDWILPEDVYFGSGVHLDGELMLPANRFTFQETVSAVRKEGGNELSEHLEFHVFDMYFEDSANMPFEERYEALKSAVDDYSSRVKLVPTHTAKTHQEVLERHGYFVSEGHEGTMVRSLDGVYKDSTTRSGDLLKLKGFTDEEFTITGFRDGDGKHEGAVVFICETADGQTFEVTPKGNYEKRRQMYEDGDIYVGKPLTVRYQDLTDDGKPRFPVGIAVRDYETA